MANTQKETITIDEARIKVTRILRGRNRKRRKKVTKMVAGINFKISKIKGYTIVHVKVP